MAHWQGISTSTLAFACSLATACGDTAAGPVERRPVPPLELSLSNEDGFIDDAGVFQSAAEGFEVGAGGDGRTDEFILLLSVTNQSAFAISDIRVTDEVAPHTGIAVCREIPPSSPDGSENPSIGTIDSPDCSAGGFVWQIGTLNGGELAQLFFRAEALAEGADVNRVALDAESVSGFLLREEPFFVGGATAELDVSVEDGFIDDPAGVFQGAKEAYAVGDGSASRPDELIYLVELINQGPVAAHDLRIVDAVGPDGEGVACREILAMVPSGGANPTIGSVDGGNCSPSGFTWRIGTLDAGNAAILLFRAEALEEGTPVNRAVLVGGGLPFPAVIEEPTAIVGN